ncbi:MAG TPA: capreomycidine synthase [Thermoanaerobaculia bacterium]|nr:capreomycidine synthase [Thermoanaerobaculia bacterium]
MDVPLALLEDWMRRYYFEVDYDLGSSGVEDYSLADLRRMVGLEWEELDRIVFHDSQTLGGERLRQAIADQWGSGDSGRVMATHGSSEANFLVMNALLRPGDEVVVTDPCYPQLFLIAQALGCRLTKVPLRFELGFQPDIDELCDAITPATRMVVLNFPHNPTGASVDAREQTALIEACARVGAYLVWDNAFGAITYDAPPLPDPTGLYERALSMGTLSKTYGLPGLRVGWCVAAPEVLEEMIRYRDYITLHLSPLVEALASRAIEESERFIGPRREQCRHNLEVLAGWCEEQRDLVAWARPRGGSCIFPCLLEVPDVEEFCHRLAREHRVMLVPGNCFGHPQHVRLGFGGPAEQFAAGLERLGHFLEVGPREAVLSAP